MKGTVVFIDEGRSGWLLQFGAANGGAQHLGREAEDEDEEP